MFFFLHYTNLGRSSSSTGWKNTLEHAFDGLYDIKVYEGSVYYNGTSAVDVGDTVSQDALFINGSFTRFSERSDMDENLMPNTIPTDSLQTSSEIRPSEPNIDLPPYVSMHQDQDAGSYRPVIIYNRGQMERVMRQYREFVLLYTDN